MRRQFLALTAVCSLGGFALASPDHTGTPEMRAEVAGVATAVICEENRDGRPVSFVCRGGFAEGMEDLLRRLLSPLPGTFEVPVAL